MQSEMASGELYVDDISYAAPKSVVDSRTSIRELWHCVPQKTATFYISQSEAYTCLLSFSVENIMCK